MAGVRVATIALAVIGMLGGTLVVGWFGFDAVGHALVAISPVGFLAFLACHAMVQAILGAAWWALVPGHPGGVATLIGARIVRDAGGDVLPLSQLGGFVLGARAATLGGLPAAMATASTIVDVTLEVIGQIAHTALGLILLLRLHPHSGLARPVAGGLVVAVVAVMGFVMVQHRGLGGGGRWLSLLPRLKPLAQALNHIGQRPWGSALGLTLHLAGWLALAGEGWLALRLLGSPLGVGAVIALESLVAALRSVGFAIPNALGVQEGGYVVIGALFGLGPETALALSLVKRGRDLAIGVPALLVWQALETRRLKE
jgi:glycosyltransferase 2 family protein